MDPAHSRLYATCIFVGITQLIHAHIQVLAFAGSQTFAFKLGQVLGDSRSRSVYQVGGILVAEQDFKSVPRDSSASSTSPAKLKRRSGTVAAREVICTATRAFKTSKCFLETLS